MGIKDLWQILAPFCDPQPLSTLENKKVAIDLSCWVCEAQNITEYTIQPRMYLRNLYFRTCYLLLINVHPIFVLEGRAPELKHKTIAARNAIQFKGAKPADPATKKPGKDRSRFNHTLKLCEEMLKLMGIACVQADGEAEALCALLNAKNFVDGIISQDSDCFAYGAKTVYRNFSISTQGAQANKAGSVEVYSLEKVAASMDFGRNKIVALALLCGSDYSDGVHGVGRDSALKLFAKVSDSEILERLRGWKRNSAEYQRLEAKIADKNICSSCGHSGKVQAHTKKGCLLCGTLEKCGVSYKSERLEIKNELNMREKALKDGDFPNEELIEEFLGKKGAFRGPNLHWAKPDLLKFIKFAAKWLTWEEIYVLEKFLPILTRWQLLNSDNMMAESLLTLTPVKIKKKRAPKGLPCYEIIWEDASGALEALIPEQIDEKLLSTIEPQNLVLKAYPDLAAQFEASKAKPKTRKKRTKVDQIGDLLANVSISEPKPKMAKPIKITEFFRVENASTPKKPVVEALDFDRSNFGDENDLDVSDIIDRIVQKKPNSVLGAKLSEFGLKIDERSNCSFFMGGIVENDLFERTFNEFYREISAEEPL